MQTHISSALSQDVFKKDILNWLISFVETPNPSLGGWPPCPFARKARLENKILFSYCETKNFEASIKNTTAAFGSDYEVAVIGCAPDSLSVEEIQKLRKTLRADIEKKNLWILFDHPNDREEMNGLSFNNGKYILAMVQKKSALWLASKELQQKGYYDSWDQNYLNALMSNRS